jgi:hypothetical protein
MIWQRILDVLERRTSFAPTWPSTGRIALWFVVGLLAVGVAVPERPGDPLHSPYRAQISSPHVFNVAAERGDQRGFFPTSVSDDQFRIAWIAGSSIQGVDPDHRTFLPGELQHDLHTIDDREVVIDMYFLSGIRIVDEYAAVLQAIDSDPDMIVVTLNPIWMLNDRAIQGWDNLNGRLLSTAANTTSSWPVLASLVGPADALWALAEGGADVFADRYHWGIRLSDRFGDSTVLDVVPAEPEQDPTELEQIAAMQTPVFFWDRYDNIVDDDISGAARQAAVFEYVARTRSAIARLAVQGIVEALDASDIPSYVYVAQFDDEALKSEPVDRALNDVEDYLAEIVHDRVGEHMIVRTESAVRAVGDLDFRDPIHVYDVAPMTDYLYGELCEFTAGEGWEASCER